MVERLLVGKIYRYEDTKYTQTPICVTKINKKLFEFIWMDDRKEAYQQYGDYEYMKSFLVEVTGDDPNWENL